MRARQRLLRALVTDIVTDRGDDPLVLKVGSADLVRGPRNDLLGGEDAILDEAADTVIGDAELRRGFGHRRPIRRSSPRNGRHECRARAAAS